MLHARPLALLTLLAILLAGCANSNGGGDGGDNGATPPPAMTNAQAKDLLQRVGTSGPETFGMRMSAMRGSQTLFTLNGTFDNASGTSYMELGGDPAVLQSFSGGDDEGGAGMGGFDFSHGLTLYVTREGALYLVNDTAFTFPPSNESDEDQSFVPRPDESPFASLFKPEEALGGLGEGNFTVTSVRSLVHRGKPAVEMNVTSTEDNGTMEGSVIVFTSPERLARIQGTIDPADDESPDLLKGAVFTADLYYEGETAVVVSEQARRAMALSYKSNFNPFSSGAPEPLTWTFLVDGGVPLAEVEVQVKDTESSDPSDVTGVSQLPNRWTMRLSNTTHSEDGVTVTFTDVDGDGKVSKDDTLRIDSDEEMPTVVLYDTKTGVYVVPGPALVVLLAGLGAAALLLRRR